MDGYTVAEAASVLGVPTERVWELLARGVLSGAPEGEGGMRVYLKPRPGSLSAPPPRTNGNGGSDGGRELSPFRELLNEFRSLTERYGQALLALGEARGEVAALRSRVDALEARIELRLPGPFGPSAPIPTPAPMRPADEDEDEPAATFVAPPPAVQPEEAAAAAAEPPPASEPAAPLDVAEPAVAASAGEPAEAEDGDGRHHRRRRAWSGRVDTSAIADALARAEDPSTADLPGSREAAEALAAFRATVEPAPAAATEHDAEHRAEPEADAAGGWSASAPVIEVEEDVAGRVEPSPVEMPEQVQEAVAAPPEPEVAIEAAAEPVETAEPEALAEPGAATAEPDALAEPEAEPADQLEPEEPEPVAVVGPEAATEPEVAAEPETVGGEPTAAEPPWMEDQAAYASATDEPDWISEEDLAPSPSAAQPQVGPGTLEPAALQPAPPRSHPDEEEVLWLGDEWDDEMESAPPGSPSPWASQPDEAEQAPPAELEWPSADRDVDQEPSANAAPQPGRLPGGRELDEALAALEALGGREDEQDEQDEQEERYAAPGEDPGGGGEGSARPLGGQGSSGPASRAYHRLRRILPH
jgi:hypothetical protein